jgi:prolyl 4-hydroxylase
VVRVAARASTERVATSRRRRHIGLRGETAGGEALQEPWIEQLSWHPRAWLYHDFMSKEECEHLVQLVRAHTAPCGGVA